MVAPGAQVARGGQRVGLLGAARAHQAPHLHPAHLGPGLGPPELGRRARPRQQHLHHALVEAALRPPARPVEGQPRIARQRRRHPVDQGVHARPPRMQPQPRLGQRAVPGADPRHRPARARVRLGPEQRVQPRLVVRGQRVRTGGAQHRVLLRGRHRQGAPRVDQHALGRAGIAALPQRLGQAQRAAARRRRRPAKELADLPQRGLRRDQALGPCPQERHAGPVRVAPHEVQRLGPGAAPRAQFVPEHDVLGQRADRRRPPPRRRPAARAHRVHRGREGQPLRRGHVHRVRGGGRHRRRRRPRQGTGRRHRGRPRGGCRRRGRRREDRRGDPGRAGRGGHRGRRRLRGRGERQREERGEERGEAQHRLGDSSERGHGGSSGLAGACGPWLARNHGAILAMA